ncbi:hypothetical protein M413DRAFT_449454 [Hebeloma cylindrosporum]|uniref:Uncharacterized protein n=1 Tax=Hebeloma cylindrosporum TaxID=76867 RepID=A0A0C2Y4K7_HEBCY|nr:hypothetical protein M413DRAFT_449454 [Hebeloma cylindrosporum h7]
MTPPCSTLPVCIVQFALGNRSGTHLHPFPGYPPCKRSIAGGCMCMPSSWLPISP